MRWNIYGTVSLSEKNKTIQCWNANKINISPVGYMLQPSSTFMNSLLLDRRIVQSEWIDSLGYTLNAIIVTLYQGHSSIFVNVGRDLTKPNKCSDLKGGKLSSPSELSAHIHCPTLTCCHSGCIDSKKYIALHWGLTAWDEPCESALWKWQHGSYVIDLDCTYKNPASIVTRATEEDIDFILPKASFLKVK